jgi:hypothetical protein
MRQLSAFPGAGIPDAETCVLHQKKRGLRNLKPYPETEA